MKAAIMSELNEKPGFEDNWINWTAESSPSNNASMTTLSIEVTTLLELPLYLKAPRTVIKWMITKNGIFLGGE